jgi:hypothetical protein
MREISGYLYIHNLKNYAIPHKYLNILMYRPSLCIHDQHMRPSLVYVLCMSLKFSHLHDMRPSNC